MTTARKGLSKRTRFEVFKRDGFRCLYCGATPADRPLHVDHVKPVSDGGGNEPHNLVTACVDCNGGKSDVPLDQRRLAPTMSSEDAKDHADQIKAYLSAQRDVADARDDLLAIAETRWADSVGWELLKRERTTLRTFIKRLGVEPVLDAIDIAASRVPASTAYQSNKTFAYFCGICWRHIKGNVRASAAPEPEPDVGGEEDDYAWGPPREWASTSETLDERCVAEVAALLQSGPCRIDVDLNDVATLMGNKHPRHRWTRGDTGGGCVVVSPDPATGRTSFVNIHGVSVVMGTWMLFAPWRAVGAIHDLNSEMTGPLQSWRLWPRGHFADLQRIQEDRYSTDQDRAAE